MHIIAEIIIQVKWSMIIIVAWLCVIDFSFTSWNALLQNILELYITSVAAIANTPSIKPDQA